MIKLKNLPDFPESWHETSLKTYIKLLSTTTKAEQVRVILGIEKGQQVEGLEKLYLSAKFLNSAPQIEETPTRLGNYELPQDITLFSTEQFEDLSNEIRRIEKLTLEEQTESLALQAAIYIQPYWFKSSYDSEQARNLAKILLDYPCTEVMGAGSFFQARYLSSESGLPMSYLRKNTNLKRRDSGSFLRLLASTPRWIWWRIIWVKTMKLFSKRGQFKGSTLQ